MPNDDIVYLEVASGERAQRIEKICIVPRGREVYLRINAQFPVAPLSFAARRSGFQIEGDKEVITIPAEAATDASFELTAARRVEVGWEGKGKISVYVDSRDKDGMVVVMAALDIYYDPRQGDPDRNEHKEGQEQSEE